MEEKILESINLISFLFLLEKIVYVYGYKRPLSPQAKDGSKIWEIVHFARRLWRNFSRFLAENYSP